MRDLESYGGPARAAGFGNGEAERGADVEQARPGMRKRNAAETPLEVSAQHRLELGIVVVAVRGGGVGEVGFVVHVFGAKLRRRRPEGDAAVAALEDLDALLPMLRP
jgi:hypothetical protein